jgi:hypothetical protein
MKIQKTSNFIGFDITKQEDYIGKVDDDLKNLFLWSNARVRFGDGGNGNSENMAGEFRTVSDTGSADTEFTVSHTLGATPIGFLVVNIDKGGVVYDSGTSWTSSNIYLKCSAANAAVTLFLLK